MLKFSSPELEKETKECLLFLSTKEKSSGGIYLDFHEINSDEFDPSEYESIIIDESYEVTFGPDYSEESITMSLRNFIDLINETKTAELKENTKCITEKRCLIRVSSNYFEDMSIIDIHF